MHNADEFYAAVAYETKIRLHFCPNDVLDKQKQGPQPMLVDKLEDLGGESGSMLG